MKDAYLAVVNKAAGFGRCGELFPAVMRQLRAAGLEIEVVETAHAGHGVEIVRTAYRDGYRRFLAVGGDGTSFEIVNGLFPEALEGSKPTIGFLPLGTGNSFLRDFTVEGVEYALRAIVESRQQPCDVIRLKHETGELYYINILSFGFVADVCTLANRRFKRLGEAGYFLAVVLCLARFQQRIFSIRLDDSQEFRRDRTALLIFNNSKFTGGKMMLAPQANTADGQLEIVRWSAGRFDFLRNFPKVYDGSHISHPKIWHGPARKVEFEFEEPMDIMVDGEVMTLRCQSLEVLPSALNVMV
ncbi:MAG: diacylglycerol kinase family protein [Acidobacteriota bacterium]